MGAGKQALRATRPVSIRGNPPMRVGFLYPFFPEVKKSSMTQSVKECFTMTLAPSCILMPGPLLAREVIGHRGQERVMVHTRMGMACCSVTMALWRILSHGCTEEQRQCTDALA